ncbi:hypothetical protein MUK42_37780, partial [Musa troglodytarum]
NSADRYCSGWGRNNYYSRSELVGAGSSQIQLLSPNNSLLLPVIHTFLLCLISEAVRFSPKAGRSDAKSFPDGWMILYETLATPRVSSVLSLFLLDFAKRIWDPIIFWNDFSYRTYTKAENTSEDNNTTGFRLKNKKSIIYLLSSSITSSSGCD